MSEYTMLEREEGGIYGNRSPYGSWDFGLSQ